IRDDLVTGVQTCALPISKLWNGESLTGKGIGVAVIDTGIAGDLPDFRVSSSDTSSRVVAAVTTNPDATTATDTFGHGTHVAGIRSEERRVGQECGVGRAS